jgi:uncharacterized protein involved in exopolysaccharide biosynthesis
MDDMKRELHDDEINLLDLVKVLLRHKGFIVRFVLVVTVGTAIVALLMTKIYESRAVIAPVIPVEEQGGGMSAVAAQFGITTPQSSNLTEIVGLLKSDVLMQKVMEKGKFYDVLFDKDDLKGKSENERTWEGIRILKEEIVKVKENKKDNIITMSAEYKDPVIAQKIASTALTELTEHMTAEAKRVAVANKTYLESEANKAVDPFIRTNVYGLIARQIQTAMLAEAKENYAFKIIDPPRVPDKKVKPKRVLMVAIAFVVSLFLGILLAFIREHYQNNREEWVEIGKMSGLRRFSWKRSHA